jgi:peroxiredoxin
MTLTKPGICDFGWKARDFALKSVDGKTYSLADVRGPKGTLVTFICNHCPYVKAVISRLVDEAKALRAIGIGTIAINANDAVSYPEDSFDNMKVFASKHGFPFPYAIDETQAIARSYGAQCTPDFFGFNAKAISRAARCVAHEPDRERAPRSLRSDEAGRRNGSRTGGTDAEHGMLDQVEKMRGERNLRVLLAYFFSLFLTQTKHASTASILPLLWHLAASVKPLT